MATPGVAPPPSGGCTLRIFHVNDVYELDNLPRLKRAIETLRTGNDVALLAGDFVSPSLLSSLDFGRSMVDCMNMAGIDYVCIGNHEADIPHGQLLQRIKESRFTWINTNMPKLPLGDLPTLPTHAVVTASGGGQTRRVGLLGLNTDAKGLYLPRSWGSVGAACVDPIPGAAKVWRERLLAEHGADVVVPMTHQGVELDRALAELGLGFPVILGGHDHEPGGHGAL